ncbi:MAG: glycoside hydrolase family 31 protein [Gammaproteobacteria bacterium]
MEAWGQDAVRVRASPFGEIHDPLAGIGALRVPGPSAPTTGLGPDGAVLINGRMEVRVDAGGRISWHRAGGPGLLAEARRETCGRPARHLVPLTGELFRAELTLEARPGERIYGLGQQQHGRLDQKGCVIDLLQRNTEVCIPLAISSLGYAFLWHNPAVGRVELARNHTRWVAEAGETYDLWVACGDSVPMLLERFTEATGPAPALPDWALGLWQSSLRYADQEEVLEVARGYIQRGLPLSVLVIDGGHWTRMGEWRFDPRHWPDPDAMVEKLRGWGIEPMVSVWPTVNPQAETRPRMQAEGYLVRSSRGPDLPERMLDVDRPGWQPLHVYDATHPGARRFLWERIQAGYLRHGIRAFWLDADEPEIQPLVPENLRYHLGAGSAWHNIYPLHHSRGFHEGLTAAGERRPLTLNRSAWAGSQRYGAAVWSGDVDCSFESLRRQLVAGLNMGLSGIPWWTTDTGGFQGGDPADPEFRELLVRWFQFATFCPILRMHGYRTAPGETLPVDQVTGAGEAIDDFEPSFRDLKGGPNEVWSFGEEALVILSTFILVRERLRPYLRDLAQQVRYSGAPPMRPLFWHFPDDPVSWFVADQFLLGSDLLVAPVLEAGADHRRVRLPGPAAWVCAWTGRETEGGTWRIETTPRERIPVFLRSGSLLAETRQQVFCGQVPRPAGSRPA